MRIDLDLAYRMTDARSLERGRDYAESGAVGRVQRLADGVRATVSGTDDYTVELSAGSGAELAFRCSCPMGASGVFCKHCVALAIVASDPDGDEPAERPDPRAYLESLDRDQLIELILDAAHRDEVLYTRLAVAGAGPDSARDLRRVIEDAVIPGGYVHYRETYDYTQGIDVVIDRLDALLDAGHAVLVIELTEHAIACTDRAVEYVDDSSGLLGSIAERLADLHLAACAAARPDQIELATRLYQRQLAEDQLEAFYDAATRYADLLGGPGLATYRDLAERDWATLPTPVSGAYDGRRHLLSAILESLAVLTGDVDAEVEVMARDLTSPHQFVRITERYQREDRNEDALAWAERGIGEFGTADARLVEITADLYHQAGRAPAAVQLQWEVMDARPTLANYQHLAEHARRDGSWPKWREWALDRVRDEIARCEPPKYSWQPPADATLLVEIFLWEHDTDQAWDEAQRGGCSGHVRMRLARACRERRPAEVLPIYQQEIEVRIGVRNNQAYAQAVELLGEVEVLFAAAGEGTEFTGYVEGVRRRHKPKRNLMKLLDARGW